MKKIPITLNSVKLSLENGRTKNLKNVKTYEFVK